MREHLIHRLLIQVLLVPPVAGHAIPLRCIWIMDSGDPPGINALADADRGIGWINRNKIRPSAWHGGRPYRCINVERELHRSIVNPGQCHDFMFQGKAHHKWHYPSPVPSPRAAEAMPVHKARGEGQGEETCSILCNVRV